MSFMRYYNRWNAFLRPHTRHAVTNTSTARFRLYANGRVIALPFFPVTNPFLLHKSLASLIRPCESLP